MKNEIENMVPAQVIALAKFCHSALLVLNSRVFTLLAMLLSAGLFAWSLYDPNWIRIVGAVCFSVLVFLPIQRMEAIRSSQPPQGESNG